MSTQDSLVKITFLSLVSISPCPRHLPVTRLHLTLPLAPSCHLSPSHPALSTFLLPASISSYPWHLPVIRLHLTLPLAPSCHPSPSHPALRTFLLSASISPYPWHLASAASISSTLPSTSCMRTLICRFLLVRMGKCE